MISTNLIIIFYIIFNLFLIIKFDKIRLFHLIIDKPDKIRKLHSKPTPLAGGLIIFFNIFIYWILNIFFKDLLDKEIFFESIKSLNYFMIFFISIFFIGIIDDKINIKANTKFFLLLLVILILLLLNDNLIIDNIKFSFLNKIISLNNLGLYFSIFCFLVFLNAFNMFDGINLQASFYSLFIFFYISFFLIDSLIIKVLIINLIFFSYLNFKNKTFLGDNGSLLLGYLISFFFISLYNLNYIKYADQITLFMLIPGLDLLRLFILRIYKKKNPLTSDRDHLHHLLLSNYSLKLTLTIIILLITFPIFLDYLSINNIYTILLTTIIYFILIVFLKKKNFTH